MKTYRMNTPNKLTLARLTAVPLYTVLLFLPIDQTLRNIGATLIFLATAITDFLDGHIARKYDLITDFGKFLDPIADKMMIFGGMCGLIYIYSDNRAFFICLLIASFIFFFREIGVTTLRMVTNTKKGVVIQASIYGKIKTVSQIAFIMAALLEPVLFGKLILFDTKMIISYILMGLMTVMTVISGIQYLRAYMPFIDTKK